MSARAASAPPIPDRRSVHRTYGRRPRRSSPAAGPTCRAPRRPSAPQRQWPLAAPVALDVVQLVAQHVFDLRQARLNHPLGRLRHVFRMDLCHPRLRRPRIKLHEAPEIVRDRLLLMRHRRHQRRQPPDARGTRATSAARAFHLSRVRPSSIASSACATFCSSRTPGSRISATTCACNAGSSPATASNSPSHTSATRQPAPARHGQIAHGQDLPCAGSAVPDVTLTSNLRRNHASV